MTDQLKMYSQTISGGSHNVISSPESVDGLKHSNLQTGLQLDLFGQPVAHAPRSPSRVSKLNAQSAKATILCGALDELATQYAQTATMHGLPTPGTYGRRCGGSPRAAALDTSMENRLIQLAGSIGSPLYVHRLKSSITILGRQVFRLRATAPRTSDKDCSGWPTPTTMDHIKAKNSEERIKKGNLKDVLAGWPTPLANPPGSTTSERGKCMNELLRGWATPTARDWKDTPGMKTEGVNPDGSIRKRMDRIVPQAIGAKLSGSNVATEKRGQLNPEFCRWLMGFPEGWTLSRGTEMQSCHKWRPILSSGQCK